MYSISVIIPTYNRKDSVINAIKSVESQTVKPSEIIVVDDGSTDDTSKIVQGLSSTIRYIQINHSGIPGKVRNVGIYQSSGDYIAFLDSDDIWLPEKLETQIKLLDTYSNIGILCSNALIQEPCLNSAYQKYLSIESKYGNVFHSLVNNNFIITSTVLIKREILENIGYFSEENYLIGIEDYDLWLRIAIKYNVLYKDQVLAIYLKHDKQISKTKTRVNYWRDLENLYKKIYQQLEKDACFEDKHVLSFAIKRCQIRIFNEFLKEKKYYNSTLFLMRHPYLLLEIPFVIRKRYLRQR